ncbi:MAG: hypothetical protein ABW185_03840 [Sedimenticola sp.]
MFSPKKTAQQQLRETQRRFYCACSQIVVLNERMADLQRRHEQLNDSRCKSTRYNMRIRIMVTQSMMTTFHHYAEQKKDEIRRLRQTLSGTSTPQSVHQDK